MQTIRYELIPAQGTEGQVAVITFDETNSPVNTMCRQWQQELGEVTAQVLGCLLYTSPSPRDQRGSRMPSSA